MKFLFTISMFLVMQTRAEAVMGQSIHLTEKKASLETLFNKIKAQSGYDFIYNKDLVNAMPAVEVNIRNATINQAVSTILANLPLDFVIRENVVVIKRRPTNTAASTVQAAVDTIVLGQVIDAISKRPISNVTISNNNGRAVTSSGSDGRFQINAKRGETLRFRFLGYSTKEIVVSSTKTSVTVSLSVLTEQLEDVVVNGIFSRKAETATGAQTTVSQKQLLEAGTVNIVQSLRNIDPSFIITENRLTGSDPNALPDINIRGKSGIPDLSGDFVSNPNLPLFILDGFETSLQRVLDLDMYRVASVTILKDAASKAIYGAKAANGVIVVETIRPLPGQLRVSFNTNIGLEVADLSSYKLTNARQKLHAEMAAGLYNANRDNMPLTPGMVDNQLTLNRNYNRILSNIAMGVETDWMAKPLQNGLRQAHSLNLSGGDERFTYGLTTNLNRVNGAMKGSTSNVFSGNLNLAYRVGSFNIRNDLTLGERKGTNSPWGSFQEYVDMNPYYSYRDINGNIAQIADLSLKYNSQGYLLDANVLNPAYNATLNVIDKTKMTFYTNNTSLDWTAFPGFRLTGRFSFTRQITESDKYLPANHNSFLAAATAVPMERRGSYSKGNGSMSNYDGQLNASYSKLLGLHAVTLNGGATITENSSYTSGFITEGFPNDRLNFPSMGLQYQANSRPNGSESLARDMGFFAASNYSYDQRYNLDLTYRTNQSSLYGVNNRWANLWSAGISWNLHNESFVRNLRFIDQFRLRATTGFTGSQGFNTYMGIGSYTYDRGVTYSGGNGAHLIALANPDLRWQRRQDHNFGLDLGFKRRFNGRIDYQRSYTDGLLTDITLPLSTGFSSFKANLGKVQNETIEIQLTYNAISDAEKRNSLNFFVSVAQNRNKLLEISNSLRAYNERQNDMSSAPAIIPGTGMGNSVTDSITNTRRNQITRPKILFEEGQSMDAIYAVQSLGIDPATGRERYLKKDGSTTYDWNVNDQVIVGNRLPNWMGNFGFNLAYSGFRMATTFRFEYGGQSYNQTLVDRVENADIYKNVDIRVLTDRWQQPGDRAFFKSITDRNVTRVSSRFVENNNTLTLAFVSLGYDLERFNSIRNLGFSQLRASLSSSELFQTSSMRIERGVAYPFARTFQFTLNANF